MLQNLKSLGGKRIPGEQGPLNTLVLTEILEHFVQIPAVVQTEHNVLNFTHEFVFFLPAVLYALLAAS